MSDPISGNSPYSGSIKMTCTEAAWMLNSGHATKVWFRPDEFIDHKNPDQDVAFVWFREDAIANAMPQTNNTESQGA